MLNQSEQFVKQYFTGDNTIPELGDAMAAVCVYLEIDYSYASKRDRVSAWDATLQPEDVVELVISIFTTTLLNSSLTIQAMCGMLNHKIKLDSIIDRVKTISEVIAVISHTGLIHITKRGQGENTVVSCAYEIDERIPTDERHCLNKYPAQKVTNNFDDIQGSMLLGGAQNHHDDEICLHHINSMNQIALRLNETMLRQYAEQPTFDIKTPDQQDQWDKFRFDSIDKYIEVIRHSGNKLYMDHKWCTRGRCYAVGYHVSTQGTSFKKAITQFHKQELVLDIIL